MPAVAASVLGPPWRGASAAQRQAFVAAFQRYLARKYGKQFREYRNARIDGDRRPRRRQGRACWCRPGWCAPARRTSPSTGRSATAAAAPKVVNLIIEGVSMLANERAEIGAMLDAQRGELDGLIAQLRAADPDGPLPRVSGA